MTTVSFWFCAQICVAKGKALNLELALSISYKSTLASIMLIAIPCILPMPMLYSWLCLLCSIYISRVSCVHENLLHSLPVLLLFDTRIELRGDILLWWIGWFVEFTASRKSLRFILWSFLALIRIRSSLFCNVDRRSVKRRECVYVGFLGREGGSLDCSSVDVVSMDTGADNIATFCWCDGRGGAWDIFFSGRGGAWDIFFSDGGVATIFSEVSVCFFTDMLDSLDGTVGDIFLLEEVNRLFSDFVMMLVLMQSIVSLLCTAGIPNYLG